MNTVEMIYKPDANTASQRVSVYDMSPVVNGEGDITQVVVTAWASKEHHWIIAPVWCFEPISKKKLEEKC